MIVAAMVASAVIVASLITVLLVGHLSGGRGVVVLTCRPTYHPMRYTSSDPAPRSDTRWQLDHHQTYQDRHNCQVRRNYLWNNNLCISYPLLR
jgi:hypothetical protein